MIKAKANKPKTKKSQQISNPEKVHMSPNEAKRTMSQ
jgi:hypothetical protein